MSEHLPLVTHSNPPIQAVPPEVLSDIFALATFSEHTVYNHHSRFYVPDSVPKSTQLHRLASVCRRWRDVSVSTPVLWSSILVHLNNDPHPASTVDKVQMHLDRSKSSPLTVTLNVESFNSVGYRESTLDLNRPDQREGPTSWILFMMVLHNAARIRQLSIRSHYGNSEPFSTSLMPRFRDRFINLERLLIDVDFSTNDPYVIGGVFTQSPLLRRVDYHSSTAKLPHLPSTHLTHITLEGVPLRHFATIMTQLPLLESVDVGVWAASSLDGEDLQRSVFPRLRTFHVSLSTDNYYVDWRGFTDFFDLLHCPALTSVSFQMPIMGDHAAYCAEFNWEDSMYWQKSLEDFKGALSNFIQRSPGIKTFRLVSMYLKDLDLFSLLRKMPQLTSLNIVDAKRSVPEGGIPVVTSAFLKELGSGGLVPRLRDLWLELPQYEFGSKWAALEEMLGDAVKRRLRSAYIRIEDATIPELDLQELRRLQAEGLAVRVVYAPSVANIWDRKKGVELLGYNVES
ncbi:hypothetical protein VNI00_010817 [Paramarasmius palmivorus]|uniref:F-box domain-containing protein n=1 Tax=Paramarasmius palmivorus TaxID=297713 RepID=A0AAW0CF18_9AGAR